MSLTASESVLSRWAALGELSTALAQGVACLEAQGLWGSSRALVVSALVRDTGRPVLYLSPGTAERHRAAEALRFFRDTLDSASVPILEFPPAEPSSWHGRHRDHVAERALVCRALVTGGANVVVTTPAALGAPILSPETFRARTFTLTVGASLEREGLLRTLETAGYERVETVVEVGQWSLRGGIVDIFSPTHDRPARAEFFGDEIDSLRLFDPTTQRSVETLGELTVLPLAGGAAGGGALRRAPRPGTRSLPAARAAAPPARRRARAAGRHGHSLGGRLPGPFQGPRGGDPELAGGRIRRASGRGRRGAGRALPRHPPGARSGAVARRHPLERRGSRRHHGRLRGGLPAARPRARPSRRRGRLRRAPAAATPSRLPAGRGHRRFHRPQPGRPRRPRGARHRPLPRSAHHGRGGPRRGFPAPRICRGRPPLPSRRAPRPDLEVHGRAVGGGAARSHGRGRLAARQGVRAGRGAPDGRAAPSPLRRALRGGTADLLGRHAVAAGIRGGLPLRGDARPAAGHRGHQAGHGGPAPHGPPRGGRCRLRQDGGRPARGLQGGGRWTAGRRPRAHHGAGPAALPHLQRSLLAVPDPRGAALPLP